jgi:hypothetical protein
MAERPAGPITRDQERPRARSTPCRGLGGEGAGLSLVAEPPQRMDLERPSYHHKGVMRVGSPPPPPIPISAFFAMLGWDNIETDQVVAIAAKTTITNAVMILRMKCIAFLRGFHRVRPANRHVRCQGPYAWADSSDVTVVTESLISIS